jgi:hypothetical protein
MKLIFPLERFQKIYDVKEILRLAWRCKEAFIWIAALIFLAFIDPSHHHYTLCPFNNLGWEWCPGCGLGRSIAFFYRMELKESFMAHPLGIPAIALLIHRIYNVLSSNLRLSTTINRMNYVDSL